MEITGTAKRFVEVQLEAAKIGAIVILVPNLTVQYTTPESAAKLSKSGTVKENVIILNWPDNLNKVAWEKKAGGYNYAVTWAKQNGLLQSGVETCDAVSNRLDVMDLIARGAGGEGNIHYWHTIHDEKPPIDYSNYDPLDDYDPEGEDIQSCAIFIFCM